MFNELKDDGKYQWTNHVKDKMAYYRISPSLVKRIVRFPSRIETGVAPNTVAVMQSRQTSAKRNLSGQTGKTVISSKKSIGRVEETWVMYQNINQNAKIKIQNDSSNLKNLLNDNQKKRIISAWRYPGISPKGKNIPIPEEIRQELESLVD